MIKNQKIEVKGVAISLLKYETDDYISLTDIARHKNPEHTDTIIQNWMRNRNTIELLGCWEIIYNPNFKPLEFDGIRKQAGLNSWWYYPTLKASTQFLCSKDFHNRKDYNNLTR